MDRLPEEIERLMVSYLNTTKILLLRCTSHSFRKAAMYHVPHWGHMKGPLRYLMSSFPYITDLKLTRARKYTEDDFEHLGTIQTLLLETCSIECMNPSYFKHLHQLRSLNLRGHTSYFTDIMFDGLISLEKLWISDNHKITDRGLQKLVHLTHLSIHNTYNISNEGLSTMSKLISLNMYNMHHVTDDTFRYLPELRHLDMSMGSITIEGLLHLKKLESLTMLACTHVRTFKGIDALPLTKVYITYGLLQDEDMYYIRHVHRISLYCTSKIQGEGLQHLTRLKRLDLHMLKIKDEHVDVLCTFPHIQTINMYDCTSVTPPKKAHLLKRLPGILHTD